MVSVTATPSGCCVPSHVSCCWCWKRKACISLFSNNLTVNIKTYVTHINSDISWIVSCYYKSNDATERLFLVKWFVSKITVWVTVTLHTPLQSRCFIMLEERSVRSVWIWFEFLGGFNNYNKQTESSLWALVSETPLISCYTVLHAERYVSACNKVECVH